MNDFKPERERQHVAVPSSTMVNDDGRCSDDRDPPAVLADCDAPHVSEVAYATGLNLTPSR